MIKCSQCGTENLDGAAFCDNCGFDLRGAVAPPPAAETAVPPVSPPEAGVKCPACGADNVAGEAYCVNCGAELVAVTPTPPPPVEAPPGLNPRLVIADTQAEIPLPAKAEILVGREDPIGGIFPDVDLTPYGADEAGVSRRHCKITLQGTQFSIEDLDTTNFTFVNKQKLTAKTPQPLNHGDEVRLGKLILKFYTS